MSMESPWQADASIKATQEITETPGSDDTGPMSKEAIMLRAVLMFFYNVQPVAFLSALILPGDMDPDLDIGDIGEWWDEHRPDRNVMDEYAARLNAKKDQSN